MPRRDRVMSLQPFVVVRRDWLINAMRHGALTHLYLPALSQPLQDARTGRWSIPNLRTPQPDAESLKSSRTLAPLGAPESVLWVREATASRWDLDEDLRRDPGHPETVRRARHYTHWRADETRFHPRDLDNFHSYGRGWKPASMMPRWAARFQVTVGASDYVRLARMDPEALARSWGMVPWTKDGTVTKWAPHNAHDDSPWAWSDMPRSPMEAFARAWADLHPRYPADLDRWSWRVAVTVAPDPYGCALGDSATERTLPEDGLSA